MAEDLTKRLYVKNVDEWKAELSKKRFSDRELEVKVVERGIILPPRRIDGKYKGGVCDSDFNFVAGYTMKDPLKDDGIWDNNICVTDSYSVEKDEVINLDEDVIFGGSLVGQFGHFIIESWSRLWYVIQHPELNSKILFITTFGGWRSWFYDFFKLMGIEKERILYVEKPMQCRSIIVPEQSQYHPITFTKEFFLPYEAIKSRVKPGKIKKIYLTRTELGADFSSWGVHCCNETYFHDFFVSRGFEAITIEKLSIEEQISLIMGADEIAAIMGTLTHWAMFCKPSTKFIMLLRAHEPLDYQAFVNDAFDVNYYFIDVSKNFMYAKRNALGVCMLGSNKYWKAFVADYFGEQIEEDDDNLYFAESLNKYVDFWYRRYSGSKDRCRNSLKDMCNRIVSLETELRIKRPVLSYQTHVAQKGWGSWKVENQLSNPFDQYDIQAVKIEFTEPFHDVYYAVYYNEAEGWSQEVSTSQMAGTTGKSKPITGIKIRLDETGARAFDILEIIAGGGVKLNSLQIKLEPAVERPLPDKHESWRAWIAKN